MGETQKPYYVVSPIKGEAKKPTWRLWAIDTRPKEERDKGNLVKDLGTFTNREDALVAGRAWKESLCLSDTQSAHAK